MIFQKLLDDNIFKIVSPKKSLNNNYYKKKIGKK